VSNVFWILGTFELTLLAIAVVAFGWGFERYRCRFVKTDLLVASVISLGLALLALVPGVFDYIGGALNLERRVVVVSFLANLVLLGLLLYYVSELSSLKADIAELTRTLSVNQAPKTDGGRDEIFVVIPAYNEGETIRDVVTSLPEKIRGYRLQPVVVSDGSADGTARNAKYNGTMVVEHPLNQGQGGALRTGFRIARENDAAIVVHKGEYANVIAQFADDIARGLVQAAEHRLHGSYNLGTDEAYSFETVVELLNEELGTNVDPEYVENPIPEPVYVHDTCADPSKMRRATGWEPEIGFRKGIRRVCALYD